MKVLDHGSIELVTSWGSDESIVEAARMSTGKGFLGWPVDEKLLRYLWEHAHHTPFEMAGATFEVIAPIFVFREWHRHRTQSYNEMSARYTPLPDVNYMPTVERLMLNSMVPCKRCGGSGTIAVSKEPCSTAITDCLTCNGKGKVPNKQASGTGAVLTEHAASSFQNHLREVYSRCEDEYQCALANGVPKELARLVLPVARYSRMRASANLRNWLSFLKLRMAPDAQWEIRQYAESLGTLLAPLFPRTWTLFSQDLEIR